MKAWQKERKIMDEAIPRILNEDEQTWDFAKTLEESTDTLLKMLWSSHVPGSYAPESIMIAAIQSMENRGYHVSNSEKLIKAGLRAYQKNDLVELNKISAQVWHEVNYAQKNEEAMYWTYTPYHDFETYLTAVEFPRLKKVKKDKLLLDKLYAAWLAQIIGGAVGTAIEGYTSAAIKKTFGQITGYIRKPNTFNDDITFELALLKAVEAKNSRSVTSIDIALNWIGYVPIAWSAEEIALRNIRYGIFPPLSGSVNNPFSDWIGAQMRGVICGLLFPGNAYEAARLAWKDAVISHDNNGVLGEVFNAVLAALCFVENDVQKLIELSLNCIPKDSEYYYFANLAFSYAKENQSWEKAWSKCETAFKEYNWIHVYPNAMAEIIALYYGQGDFEKTLNIVAMAGQDVDCNAAQILTVLGVMGGIESIPPSLIEPIGDRLDTYLREDKVLSIQALAQRTYTCIKEKKI